jgi:hypothetical protein
VGRQGSKDGVKKGGQKIYSTRGSSLPYNTLCVIPKGVESFQVGLSSVRQRWHLILVSLIPIPRVFTNLFDLMFKKSPDNVLVCPVLTVGYSPVKSFACQCRYQPFIRQSTRNTSARCLK